MATPTRQTILDADAVASALERMAGEIVTFAGGTDRLVLVGIQRRGAELAERLVERIAAEAGTRIPLGVMDITLYRDDLQTIGPRPVVGETHLPHDLDHKVVMIVDDVLFTGRTVRAAMDQLADFGRPSRIGLCVLVDRGGRELPIQADIVGAKVEATSRARVDVLVRERDGRDAVELADGGEP